METQEYAVFIDNEVKGPFAAADLEAKIAAGELAPDTLVAPVGSEDWAPASQFFTFPESAFAAPESQPTDMPETLDKERPELNPLLRKRVIQLGLASATTVDEMTEVQARTAVALYEAERRKERKQKWLGGFGAGAGVLLVFGGLLAAGPARPLTDAIAKIFVKPETEEFIEEAQNLRSSMVRVREADETVRNDKNIKPPTYKGEAGRTFLRGRVQVPDDKRERVIFQADFAKLGEFTKSAPTFLYLAKLDHNQRKEMNRQSALVWKYLHPTQLKTQFLLADAKGNADTREIDASWKLFRAQCAEKFNLDEFVKTHTVNRLTGATEPARNADGELGTLLIDGRNPDYLAAAVTVKVGSDPEPFTVYFPAGRERDAQSYLIFQSAKSSRMTANEAFAIEQYTIAEKLALGGKPCGVEVRFMDKRYFRERKTPFYYYLGLKRPRIDSAPVWMRVDAKRYEDAQIGTKLASVSLADEVFFQGAQPPESTLSGGLTFKPDPRPIPPPKPPKAPAKTPSKDAAKPAAAAATTASDKPVPRAEASSEKSGKSVEKSE
jgi:hypothetical protein